jgi:hypothetical protein
LDRETLIATILDIAGALTLFLLITYQPRIQTGGFTITLTLNNTNIVTEADIIHHNVTSHEFTLTDGCAQRLKPMGWRLSGNFMMAMNGEVVLRGIFVPPIVSRSYPSSQVVITYPTFELNFMVMKVQTGYPWDQPVASDPRDNPMIADYF